MTRWILWQIRPSRILAAKARDSSKSFIMMIVLIGINLEMNVGNPSYSSIDAKDLDDK